MPRLRRPHAVLAAAAVPAAVLSALLPSAPAAAAPEPASRPAADARLEEPMADAGLVTVEGHEVPAGLLLLRTPGGEELRAYCVDVDHDAQPGTRYRETAWGDPRASAVRNLDRVGWVLRHSYPFLTLRQTAREAGVPEASLTADDAAAGTQAALWHFSDGLDAPPVDADARGLAAWLVRNAGRGAEPAAGLSLLPPRGAGRAGGTLGPFRVRGASDGLETGLDPAARRAGVVPVDRRGAPLPARVRPGTGLYLRIPEGAGAGSAEFTVSARQSLPVGRILTSEPWGAREHSQTMVLAASEPTVVRASARARWTAAPAARAARSARHRAAPGRGPGLAATGGPSLPVSAGYAAAGAVLLLAGLALRRRSVTRRR
ncbi:thioester domain-containing protein [Streptomyces sp. NPDC001380]|uniref:thioester domain-containing protein n=1 Tax=Streptomyces sp. NPDC001380 TaxID=3364566 RepID=UPI0036BBAE3D